jgi:hypothetical protein
MELYWMFIQDQIVELLQGVAGEHVLEAFNSYKMQVIE